MQVGEIFKKITDAFQSRDKLEVIHWLSHGNDN